MGRRHPVSTSVILPDTLLPEIHAMTGFASIICKVEDGVGHLVLSRPAKSNSISKQMWEELPRGLDWLLEQGARVVRGLAQPPPRARTLGGRCWRVSEGRTPRSRA